MALNDLGSLLGGRPQAIDRTPQTALVVRSDDAGVWVAPVGSDARHPIGPCYGPLRTPVGALVILVWTQDRPWVFGGVTPHELDTTDVHGIPDTALLETQAGAQTKALAAAAAVLVQAQADIATAVADLVDSAPETLDTLGEIAAALAADDAAIDALLASIGGKETPAGAQSKVDAAIDAHEDPDARHHGDSGLRRVVDTGDLADLPDLVVITRRRGDVVTVYTREPSVGAFTGDLDLFTLPVGFRPDAHSSIVDVYDPDTGAAVPGAQLLVRSNGLVRLIGATSGAKHYAAFTGTTSATWPAGYPGTEEGA